MRFSPVFNKVIASSLSVVLFGVSCVYPSTPAREVKRTVFHVQDIHMNAEAQQSVSATLQELMAKHPVDVVALEGAFEPIDLSLFRDFPHRPTLRLVSDYLLRQNKLSGAIHGSLVSGERLPRVVGIDDSGHYHANIAAYLASRRVVADVKNRLMEAETRLQAEKRRLFPLRLASFDRKVETYRAGQMPLKDYAKELVRLRGIRGGQTPLFLAAVKFEALLDFKQPTIETLNVFLRYRSLADRFEAPALLRELKSGEEAVFAALIQTPQERELVDAARRLYLAKKLVDFSLTSEEWPERI